MEWNAEFAESPCASCPYKSIVGKMTPMPKRETTWPTTSVSLITGERERS
jgi:hypothetical protein